MGRKSNRSAAAMTAELPGVSLREQHDLAQMPPPVGVTLLVLRCQLYKTVHLARWVTKLSLTRPLCESEDVTIGPLSTDHEIDRSGRPPSSPVCNACFAEASRIGGVYRK